MHKIIGLVASKIDANPLNAAIIGTALDHYFRDLDKAGKEFVDQQTSGFMAPGLWWDLAQELKADLEKIHERSVPPIDWVLGLIKDMRAMLRNIDNMEDALCVEGTEDTDYEQDSRVFLETISDAIASLDIMEDALLEKKSENEDRRTPALGPVLFKNWTRRRAYLL